MTEASAKTGASAPLTEPEGEHEELHELAQHMPDAKLATAPGIAAIALSMAMKYHDIATVQDGALYQQYKLEGKNMRPIHIDYIFETAARIEVWLLGASERIASLVVDAITHGVEEDSAQGIEARSDETEGLDPKGESPVAEGDAP